MPSTGETASTDTVTVAEQPVKGHLLRLLLPPPEAPRAQRRFSAVLLFFLAVCGYLTLSRQVTGFLLPDIYEKDFTQEYLLARAVVDRTNPYVLQPELAARYLPSALRLAPGDSNVLFPRPGSHPPLVAALATPLGLLSYETACGVWLAFEVALLGALSLLLWRNLTGSLHYRSAFLTFSILLLWLPVSQELFAGQLNLLLAVLLTASWLMYRRGRTRLAGMLLGGAIAVKLFPGLLLGYFLLKRQWRTVIWAVVTAIVLFGAGGVVIGAEGFKSYLIAGRGAASFLWSVEGNYSLFVAIWRFFAGSLSIQPVAAAPALALPLASIVIGAVLLMVALVLFHVDDADTGWGVLMSAMLLVGPVTWAYYFVLLISPFGFLARRLYLAGWPVRRTNLFLLAVMVLGIPTDTLVLNLARMVSASPSVGPSSQLLPGVAQLPLLLLPLVPGLVLGVFLRELSQAGRERR